MNYKKLRDKLKIEGVNLRRIPMKGKMKTNVFHSFDFFEFEAILIWLAINKKVAGKKQEEKYYFKEILSFQHGIVSDDYIYEHSKEIKDKPSRRNFEQHMKETRDYTKLSNKYEWREGVLEKIRKIAPEYVFYDDIDDVSTGYLLLVMDEW